MTAVREASPVTRGAHNSITRRVVPLGAVIAAFMMMFVASLQGQARPEQGRGVWHAAPSGAAAAAALPTEVRLLVGRSALLNLPVPITRVSLTTPDVADALVTTPQQVLIHGKAPGTISLLVWDRIGGISTFEVTVERDLSSLVDQVRQLFPGEPISVAGNGKDIVLSGTVSSKYVVEKAADVAAGYVEKKEHVVNLLRQQEGVASNQILLRVRFAEVSRSALSELGASFFTGPGGYKGYYGRSTTQQFAAPIFDEENGRTKLVFSDFLNLFLFDAEEQLGTLIKALQGRGLFQSLAEPNLVAQNGKEASFLAGGEYPYPAVQGGTNNLAITIMFKEFGIRLNFVPTVLGDDLIHLKVKPEVSALDFTNAVSLQGFRIPALSTRRAETEVELRDGQTFAIAGLLNNTLTETMQKIPGIGDIPILGMLFRSRALQKSETELVVMITPQILRRNSVGVSPVLPNLDKPFLAPPKGKVQPPEPWTPKDGSFDAPAAATSPAPAAVPARPASAPAPVVIGSSIGRAPQRQPEAAKTQPGPALAPAPASAPARPATIAVPAQSSSPAAWPPTPAAPASATPPPAAPTPAAAPATGPAAAPAATAPVTAPPTAAPSTQTAAPAAKPAPSSTSPAKPPAAAPVPPGTSPPPSGATSSKPASGSKPDAKPSTTSPESGAKPTSGTAAPPPTARTAVPLGPPLASVSQAAVVPALFTPTSRPMRTDKEREQARRSAQASLDRQVARGQRERADRTERGDTVATTSEAPAPASDRKPDAAAREQARREAQMAKAAEEAARKQSDIDRKRAKAIAEANERLRVAQLAYQAEVAKAAAMGTPPK